MSSLLPYRLSSPMAYPMGYLMSSPCVPGLSAGTAAALDDRQEGWGGLEACGAGCGCVKRQRPAWRSLAEAGHRRRWVACQRAARPRSTTRLPLGFWPSVPPDQPAVITHIGEPASPELRCPPPLLPLPARTSAWCDVWSAEAGADAQRATAGTGPPGCAVPLRSSRLLSGQGGVERCTQGVVGLPTTAYRPWSPALSPLAAAVGADSWRTGWWWGYGPGRGRCCPDRGWCYRIVTVVGAFW